VGHRQQTVRALIAWNVAAPEGVELHAVCGVAAYVYDPTVFPPAAGPVSVHTPFAGNVCAGPPHAPSA
jgi:hypothetical protein